jgi:hypothetical protein
MTVRPNRAASLMSIALAVLVPLLTAAVIFLLARARSQDAEIRQQAHAALQQNVNARYDDCVAGDAVREALYQQTIETERSDPLLYRLLPSLDTPEVHALIKENRARQLKAFAPRGQGGCEAYALRVIPPGSRRSFRIPR